MLKSNIKGVLNGFPLRIEADKVEVKETEFNAGMLTSRVGASRGGLGGRRQGGLHGQALGACLQALYDEPAYVCVRMSSIASYLC